MKEKQHSLIKYILVFFTGFAVCAGITLFMCFGVGGGPVMISNDVYDHYKELDDRYSKVNAIYDTVMEGYYIEPDATELEDGLCRGLMSGLNDPYSAYMTEKEYSSWMDSVTGEFEGIGISFTTDENGNYVIVSVFKNSPAEKAGLEAGDFILAADGKSYPTMDALSAAIKGKRGTKVTITYERDGKPHDVKMTRENIEEISVEGEILDNNIGYIAISSFAENTAEKFRDQLDKMESAEVSGLIIDLRNNGGGMVNTCQKIADMLLGECEIVSMENRKGEKSVLESDADKTLLPYVVLVNENSASASEILAGAIKDNTDNPLVGVTTFGKGIVQTSGQLEDGSALEMTTMQYFSPNGNKIHKKGVKPDYVVENTETEDKQLKKAIELLK
jgi:carboxyl-terminal processing protease